MLNNNTWQKHNLKYLVQNFIEAYALDHAYAITTVTSSYLQYLIPIAKCKIISIPCSINPEEVPVLRKFFRPRDRCYPSRFIYVGKLFDIYYSPAKFSHVVAKIVEFFPKAEIVICTDDAKSYDYFSSVYSRCFYVSIKYCASREEILKELCLSDVGLVCVNPNDTSCFNSSIKIAEYLLAGLTILMDQGVGEEFDKMNSDKIAFSYDELRTLKCRDVNSFDHLYDYYQTLREPSANLMQYERILCSL